MEENEIEVGDYVMVLESDEYYFNCEQGVPQKVVRIHDIEDEDEIWYFLSFSDNREVNAYREVKLVNKLK